MKKLFLTAGTLITASMLTAQIDVGGMVKNKVNQRIEQKTNEAIDKTLDETEEGAKDAVKGGKKGKNKGDAKEAQTEQQAGEAKAGEPTVPADKKTLKTYGKFDFVPGEKVLLVDQFENVAVGDYPVEWNTNSSGEIVTVDGQEGKWLQFNKEGVFMPDYITELPENFTMQFDVMVNEDFNFYSNALRVMMLSTQNRGRLNDFNEFSQPPLAVSLKMHPRDAGSGAGSVMFENYDSESKDIMSNSSSTQQFFVNNNTRVHVSIWRQKTRLRVYFNEEKVLDIPRAFDATAKYNAVSFGFGGKHQEQDRYLIGNINLAVGAPDTRSKLITEGKVVTRGILFDTGSDKIKPESYGAIKEIATVLKENPDVKVLIVGHTDSDGDDAKNMDLSKKRAAAVKDVLIKEFQIDAGRMTTDGKGESQPSDKNDTPVGKANNRRVEFIKQ